jgi:hypothetical protein
MSFKRVYIFFITVLVAGAAFVYHFNPDNFLADDAYFYPQIANNVVQGYGSTFHQYAFTNGYQPLWMIFSIIGAGIANGDKLWLLHVLGIFQVVLFLVTAYYLFKITEIGQLRFFSVGLAFLTVLLLTVGGLRLFEAHLAIALQMAALYLFLYFWPALPSISALAAVSLLLGMVFLARTDAWFFSAAYGIALGIRILKEQKSVAEKCLRICAVGLPAIFIAIGYMVFNKVAFGHPVPISGVIKTTYPHIHLDWNALGFHGAYIVTITSCVLVLAIGLLRRQPAFQALFGVCLVAILLHAAYLILFSWGSQWYYTTAFAVFPIALQCILTYVAARISYARVFSFCVCTVNLVFLGAMVAVGYLKTYYDFSIYYMATGKQTLGEAKQLSNRRLLAEAINKNVEPNAGIAVFDSPGALAYYSHARILPLDGLVNDRGYDSHIVKYGFLSYLKQQDIDYFLAADVHEGSIYRSSTLVTTREGHSQKNTVFAPVQKIPIETFVVEDEQKVFESPNPIPGCCSFEKVACWRL